MRLLLCACAGLGLAGTAGATDSATIEAPRLAYASAFAGLPPVADPAPIAWAQSNALMAGLRGHAGHVGRASQAGPANPPRETPPHGADRR